MSEQCKEHVFSNRRDDFRGHQCGNKSVNDGLCTIHQPEYKVERARKAQEAYDLKWENTPIKKAHRRIAELEERIETNYQEYQDMDAHYEKAIKEFESQLQALRTLAQAAVDAKYVDEGELDALAKYLGD